MFGLDCKFVGIEEQVIKDMILFVDVLKKKKRTFGKKKNLPILILNFLNSLFNVFGFGNILWIYYLFVL